MRLSDGQIRESEFGVAIELACDNFAAWTMVTWSVIFALDQKTINKLFTEKIENCQQSLSYWQGLKGKRCSMSVIDEEFNARQEAAVAKTEQENSEK